MARRITCGFEMNDWTLEPGLIPSASPTPPTISSTTKRTGSYSLRINPASGVAQYLVIDNAASFAGAGFLRFYFNIATLPTSGNKRGICQIGAADGTASIPIYINSAGKVEFWKWKSVGGLTQLTTTTGAASTGTWYLLELKGLFNGASSDYTLKVFGETMTYSPNDATSNCGNALLGTNDTLSSTLDMYIDDVAWNDTTGSAQTGFAGEGKVVLALPTSDNNRGIWTAGAGGTTNLWDAVNNIPPGGLTTETNTSNIKVSSSNASDSCDLDTASYSTLGVGSADTVNVIQAWCRHGEHQATQSATGALTIAANPAQGADDTFTFGATASGAHGDDPGSGFWGQKDGSKIYAPSVTIGSPITLRVKKTVSSATRVYCVDFLAAYVDYTPANLPAMPPVNQRKIFRNMLLRR